MKNIPSQGRDEAWAVNGFTLTELLVVLGILALFAVVAVASFRIFSQESDVAAVARQAAGILRLARSNTISSEGGSQFGVFFSTVAPAQYVLFKGATFASRDPAADQIFPLPRTVLVSQTTLADGGTQVVFQRVNGGTSQYGTILFAQSWDSTKTAQITIDSSGDVSLGAQSASSDQDRVKDSRHVHIAYSRAINTTSETIHLVFPVAVPVTYDIPIAQSMSGGQIFWQGTIVVEGQPQTIVLLTHSLNGPSTQFSIRRDLRLNTKPLTVQLSGDASGTLVRYDAAGMVTQGTSIYASSPDLQ